MTSDKVVWYNWTPSIAPLVIDFGTSPVNALWIPIIVGGAIVVKNTLTSAVIAPTQGNGSEIFPIPTGISSVTLTGSATVPFYVAATTIKWNPFRNSVDSLINLGLTSAGGTTPGGSGGTGGTNFNSAGKIYALTIQVPNFSLAALASFAVPATLISPSVFGLPPIGTFSTNLPFVIGTSYFVASGETNPNNVRVAVQNCNPSAAISGANLLIYCEFVGV